MVFFCLQSKIDFENDFQCVSEYWLALSMPLSGHAMIGPILRDKRNWVYSDSCWCGSGQRLSGASVDGGGGNSGALDEGWRLSFSPGSRRGELCKPWDRGYRLGEEIEAEQSLN